MAGPAWHIRRSVFRWRHDPGDRMAKIISLNQRRKARDKAQTRRDADANAARFGRSKAQKRQEAAEAEKARKTLDEHRRDDE